MLSELNFYTDIVYGEELKSLTDMIVDFKHRFLFNDLEKFITDYKGPKICALYGLRRTGKTVMLLQSIKERIKNGDIDSTVYIKMDNKKIMMQLKHDLRLLNKAGVKYVYIDEITLTEDFINTSSILSDIFGMMGMKIVISGTDSLGIMLASCDELYDRVKLIHTTYIPFKEFSYVLDIDDIDNYIEYGGTFLRESSYTKDHPFYNVDNVNRYIDTAITKNIQRTLELYKDGYEYGPLWELYASGELTNVINRIIEDKQHRFLIKTIDKHFKSRDLGSLIQLLTKDTSFEHDDSIIQLDKETITNQLKSILLILNKDERNLDVSSKHLNILKNYLLDLDLIYRTEIYNSNLPNEEYYIFTQPGMRYCQAKELVNILCRDSVIKKLSVDVQKFIFNKLLQDVKGTMLEDIIYLDTLKSLDNEKYQVFKYQFNDTRNNIIGEFDMVIYCNDTHSYSIYEIKHSDKIVENQYKHLINEQFITHTNYMFGKLISKNVIYLGIDCEYCGINYLNANKYLKSLPDIQLPRQINTMSLF